MPSEMSRLRVTQEADVTTVGFLDRNILDEANIQAIGEEIVGLVDAAARPRILISFSNVDHLSSAALGVLITVHNRIRAKKGDLRLSDIDPQLYEVFFITRLHKIFQIHETRADALKSFA